MFDKVKSAGAATLVVALGAWLISATTNWLKLKGVPEDVVAALGLFVGGLVATAAGYLKTETTGYSDTRTTYQRGQVNLPLIVWVLLIVILVIVLLRLV